MSFKLLPRFNLVSMPGDLPLFLKVKLTSSDLPNATVADYARFAKVQIDRVTSNIMGTGRPYSSVDSTKDASFTQHNRFPCTAAALNTPFYLESVLFSSSVAANFYLIQTMVITFFNFDG